MLDGDYVVVENQFECVVSQLFDLILVVKVLVVLMNNLVINYCYEDVFKLVYQFMFDFLCIQDSVICFRVFGNLLQMLNFVGELDLVIKYVYMMEDMIFEGMNFCYLCVVLIVVLWSVKRLKLDSLEL